ncbi:MAG TPA: SBBP repeat-containing protein, partial [Blastocatellia bacterium]|nr:SBBP repeat-containing protein [Blastocatellia bacterium]
MSRKTIFASLFAALLLNVTRPKGLLAFLVAATLLMPVRGGAGAIGGVARGARSEFGSTRAAGGRQLAVGSPAAVEKARAAYPRLPIQFEENRGQSDPQARFICRWGGQTVFLTADAAWIALAAPAASAGPVALRAKDQQAGRPICTARRAGDHDRYALRMKIEGASPGVRLRGEGETESRVNYLTGSDPSRWRTDIPTFSRVVYQEVYKGIDLVYYGNQDRQMEYDFLVRAGADPERIALRFEGQQGLQVDALGDLVIRTPAGEIMQRRPVVYQEAGRGDRHEIECAYRIGGDGRIGFDLGSYDTSLELIIDPGLVYSTYLSGSGNEEGTSIAIDSSGSAYITGNTTSTDFPITPGAFQESLAGDDADAFVTKLKPDGSGVVYSTYLGGSDFNTAKGISVDSSGSAYITGETASTDFPITNGAFRQALSGDTDAFVTKLNPDGSGLMYSTYLGGGGEEEGDSIAIDPSGNAYITGFTTSTDFQITAGAFQQLLSGGGDAFVTKLKPDGSGTVYSTYLGGGDDEEGDGIAIDSSGSAYITGETNSADFPVTER